MSKNKELGSQYLFIEREGELSLPKRIVDFDGGEEVAELVSSRKLWKNKPIKGHCLYGQMQDELMLNTFNPENWQILDTIDQSKLEKKSKYSGLIIRASKVDEGNEPLIFESIEGLNRNLKSESPVFLLEEKAPKSNGLDATEMFERAGLVDRHFRTRLSESFFLTEGRMEKKRKARKGINLIDPNRPSIDHYRHLWETMVKGYRKEGFEIINRHESKILEVLRNSTYPERDRSRLKMGYGVEVENIHCGCKYEIDINGNIKNTYPCGICDQQLPRLNEPEE